MPFGRAGPTRVESRRILKGAGMGKTLLREQSPDTYDVVKTLRAKGIQFYGPLRTPGGHSIFFMRGMIYLESELVDLSKQGRLDKKGLAVLGQRIAGRVAEF